MGVGAPLRFLRIFWWDLGRVGEKRCNAGGRAFERRFGPGSEVGGRDGCPRRLHAAASGFEEQVELTHAIAQRALGEIREVGPLNGEHQPAAHERFPVGVE